MAVKAQRVTVTTTATRIDATAERDLSAGQRCMVRNRDASLSVFLGGADVTAAAGFEVLPGESVPVDLFTNDTLWAITASGSALCHVIQAGV